eukprot:TRINITY_DN65814_c0_g1_i1.p1 TRINITY_DN65814_c0_g1~~TRINITY_DN65814_c0_g1_i1.p1  ORF type:complete len:134 (+),score=7.22 TRINITY_DN65814_c0_g1_i1:55-456(+)
MEISETLDRLDVTIEAFETWKSEGGSLPASDPVSDEACRISEAETAVVDPELESVGTVQSKRSTLRGALDSAKYGTAAAGIAYSSMKNRASAAASGASTALVRGAGTAASETSSAMGRASKLASSLFKPPARS